MSVGFSQLQIGDTLEVKGPLGSVILQNHESIIYKGVSRTVTKFGLVCGGSGECTAPISCYQNFEVDRTRPG